MVARVALILLLASPAFSADFTFSAALDGKFTIVPADKDQDGDTVSAGFYKDCTVTASWTEKGVAKTATVTVTAPTPGTPYLVGFPAAKNGGTGTGVCTNNNGVIGAVATADITFRLGTPAKPVLSK